MTLSRSLRSAPVLAASLFAALVLPACGNHASTSALVEAEPAAAGELFVLRDPTYDGRIAIRSGVNEKGAVYTYAGEYDATYNNDEIFDSDAKTLTEGLPPIIGTYRIISTHANQFGGNLFGNPAVIQKDDVVIYNACSTALDTWAQNQAKTLNAVVYGTDGTVSDGLSEKDWYKHFPDGTRVKELPPGTNYDSGAAF